MKYTEIRTRQSRRPHERDFRAARNSRYTIAWKCGNSIRSILEPVPLSDAVKGIQEVFDAVSRGREGSIESGGLV